MQKLLLLHGAIGSQDQFSELKRLLKGSFEMFSLNFSGHGGNEIPESRFSISLFAKNVLDFLDYYDIGSIDIFGYSMGGYVALYIARFFPLKAGKIFTLATKFDWNENNALKESQMLKGEFIKEKNPLYAAELIKRHKPANWEQVLEKTADMMMEMGKNKVLADEDFQSIENPVLLGIGDNDKMVSLAETRHVIHQIKNSRLLVLEDTRHSFEKVNNEMLAGEMKKWFTGGPA